MNQNGQSYEMEQYFVVHNGVEFYVTLITLDISTADERATLHSALDSIAIRAQYVAGGLTKRKMAKLFKGIWRFVVKVSTLALAYAIVGALIAIPSALIGYRRSKKKRRKSERPITPKEL